MKERRRSKDEFRGAPVHVQSVETREVGAVVVEHDELDELGAPFGLQSVGWRAEEAGGLTSAVISTRPSAGRKRASPKYSSVSAVRPA